MMHTNHIRWTRRILSCVAVLCLTVTTFGVQPAQASPLASSDYILDMEFLKKPPNPTCIYQTVPISFSVSVKQVKGLLTVLTPFTDGWIEGNTEVGALLPTGKRSIPAIYVGQTAIFDFTYTAVKEGEVMLKFAADMPRASGAAEPIIVNVVPCKYDIHGSSNLGGPINAMMPTHIWEAVGNYDIAGTLEVQEDGKSLKGEAVASQYLDAIFLGGLDDVTCQHVTPWQGNTKVDLEADPNAWANEGELVLKLTAQPMQVNTTQVVCKAPNGGGSGSSPPFTVASFDLNFDALPSEGGTTGLDFQFPNGRATFHIDLIVSPQEAGS